MIRRVGMADHADTLCCPPGARDWRAPGFGIGPSEIPAASVELPFDLWRALLKLRIALRLAALLRWRWWRRLGHVGLHIRLTAWRLSAAGARREGLGAAAFAGAASAGASAGVRVGVCIRVRPG